MTSQAFDRVTPATLRRGAELLADILHSEGVRYVFGNPGTTELPVIEALGQWDFSYVLGLQEASVVAMADGYAQASGRVGFVNLHSAGGLGHAMGAIINAQVSNTPLVVTAGQQDLRHLALDPLLSGNLAGIASPVVKWAREVTHPDQIPVLVRRAFNDSRAAPSGPVFLSLPLDVMEGITAASAGTPSTRVDARALAGSLDAMSEALAGFLPGKMALVAGEEVFTSGAGESVVRLAETLAAPVFGSSWPGHIPFPTAHPLWRGPLPPQASAIRDRLAAYDGLFLLGGQSLITYVYSEGSPVPSHCNVYQLSADPGELGRTYPVTLACVGDIEMSLRALLPLLTDKVTPHRRAVSALLDKAAKDRDAAHDAQALRLEREGGSLPISPYVAAGEVARAIGPDVAIVDEAPATMGDLRAFLRSWSCRQYLFTRSAILGWAMPAAIGTSLGLDRQPVVAVLGDGAAMYSPQALWTAAHEKLPVTFVVMNNREYNILKVAMRRRTMSANAWQSRFVGMELADPAIDFVGLARSLGVAARRVESAGDIGDAVAAGIASGLPNLVEIPIGTA
ncbi:MULTISPECIES: thiamine pyrophosphate-binding protein [Rhodomicrobium]|uniref:thiamine pyrophosphate-binding protein n=1 Tax=Rhodomicrobium TaxID=1068 RepID=UPI000B4B0439|nr:MULTISPECIES: thiamine pyrophosphate-binding protein [Rhodomicrobium]